MVIHRELCKRLKIDPADKWYMNKPENEPYKILGDKQIIYPRPEDLSYCLLTKRKEFDICLIN